MQIWGQMYIGHVIKNIRQENRYIIEHQKESRPFRNHSNPSNKWTRQNHYEDNYWFKNQNKGDEIQIKERKLFDEMKEMIHDLRNEMDRKFSFLDKKREHMNFAQHTKQDSQHGIQNIPYQHQQWVYNQQQQ